MIRAHVSVWLIAFAVTSLTGFALNVYAAPAPGNMSVYSDSEAMSAKQIVWGDVPKFATGIYSDSGDALQINVTADVTCAKPVLLRVLIDQAAASPAFVEFLKPVSATRGTRSFTFTASGVTSGFHLVRVQWRTSAETATIATRTLQVRSIGTSGSSRLSSAVSEGLSTNPGSGWLDISGLTATVTTATTTVLEMKVGGEVGGTSGAMWVRATVDGLAANPSDVLLHSAADPALGTRTATFNQAIAAGTHTIVAQWMSDGSVTLANKVLSVTADEPTNAEGGIASNQKELAPEAYTSTSWVDVPSASVALFVGSKTGGVGVAATATVEAWTSNSGRIYLRALVDGMTADPGEVALDPEAVIRTQSFVFTRKDFQTPNFHVFRLQARVDEGTVGYIGDRVMSAVAVRRTGGDYVQPQAQPLGSLSPTDLRVHQTLIICLDPLRPGHPRPTTEQVRNWFIGADGGTNVRSWFQQVSGGHIQLQRLEVLGCGSPSLYNAPPDHRGDWYWNTPGGHEVKWQDAIKAADADFDFHYYDRNGDNNLTPDELLVIVAIPQADPYGTAQQWASVAVDGNPTPLNVQLVDSYHTADPALRDAQVGLYVHELSHQLFNALDIYIDSFNWPTRAGKYSVMDDRSRPRHPDPYHKLRAGFVFPDLIDINLLGDTRDLTLDSVELERQVEIVYDPARGPGEYFILENRWNGAATPYNYDSTLTAGGLALWHIIEDKSVADAWPPEGISASAWTSFVVPIGWGRTGIRFLGVLQANTYKKLKWSDGTPAHIRLYANDPPGTRMNVTIEKTVQRMSGTVEPGEWAHYGPFKVLPGDKLVATLTGIGDADLYVRRGARPTELLWDCRPFISSPVEQCTVADGDVYVSVRGFVARVTFELEVNYDGGA